MVLKDENGNDHLDKVDYINWEPSLYDGEFFTYHKTIVHEITLHNYINYKNSSFNIHVVLENGEETDELQLKTRSRIQEKAKPWEKVKLNFQQTR